MNVYDIRHDQNLYYIFSKETKIEEKCFSDDGKTAVLVNLFYYDDLDWYICYLDNIPQAIHLYIFSSDERILKTFQVHFSQRNNLFLICKQNRGRDITALLIEGKRCFFSYDYVCFIHDKKWTNLSDKEDVQKWTRNLWECMLGSEQYINNVISTMRNNHQIGLLVPPEPMSLQMGSWYHTGWSTCYAETRKIAEKLQLDVEITPDKPPISLSTVFWCRTKAVSKLIKYPWQYEDFPEEPLPQSGTISHGIERIIAYVTQDTGYQTGMVMTDEIASGIISFAQYHFQKVFQIINQNLNINNLKQFYNAFNQKDAIADFFASNQQVYLYGAGVVGKRALKCIRAWNYEPQGFIVSEKTDEQKCKGLPIIQLDELKEKEELGIIVSVGDKYQKEVIKRLKDNNYKDYLLWKG